MQATAFQNTSTQQIVIAYEGTNLNNLSPSNFASYLLPQLGADAAIAEGTNPAANADALQFAQSVAKIAGGNPIFLTGHSLGGEEAEYVAYAAGLSDSGFTISGGAAFGAPGVPNLSAQDLSQSVVQGFTTYLDYGDAIGGFVPNDGAYVGNVKMVGNPDSATVEESLLEMNGVVPGAAGAALALMFADHQLTTYALDLSVTLPATPNQSNDGAPDVMEFYNTSGIIPFGQGGIASPSAPQAVDGSLLINGETLTPGTSSTDLELDDGASAAILTTAGQTVNAGTLGVQAVVDPSGSNALNAGSGSQVTLVGDAPDPIINGGSGQNLLIDLGNDGTVIGGSGSNQILLGGSLNTVVSTTGPTTLTDTGFNNTAALGSDAVVNESGIGNTITVGANSSLTFGGVGLDTAIAGSGSTVNVTSGGGYTFNISGDTIDAQPGTAVDVNGNNNQFEVNLGAFFAASGGNNTFNGVQPGDALQVSNTGTTPDSVNASRGLGGAILVNSGAQVNLGGIGYIVVLGADASANVSNSVVYLASSGDSVQGSGDQVFGSNASFSIAGNNNRFFGSDDHYTMSGSNNSSVGTGNINGGSGAGGYTGGGYGGSYTGGSYTGGSGYSSGGGYYTGGYTGGYSGAIPVADTWAPWRSGGALPTPAPAGHPIRSPTPAAYPEPMASS